MNAQRSPEEVARLYGEAVEKFSHDVDNPDRKVPLWLFFTADIFNSFSTTDYAVVVRENKSTRIELPVPVGVREAELRQLLKSLIRDGFNFDSYVVAVSQGGNPLFNASENEAVTKFVERANRPVNDSK
jgi:hypothetical protein